MPTADAALGVAITTLLGGVVAVVKSWLTRRDKDAAQERTERERHTAEDARTRRLVEELLRTANHDCEQRLTVANTRITSLETRVDAAAKERAERMERLARLEVEHQQCAPRIASLERRLTMYDRKKTPTSEEWAAEIASNPEGMAEVRR